MLPDRQAREKLTAAMRALVGGLISNEEFLSRIPDRSSDPAIRALLSDNAWRLYGGTQGGEQHLADRDRGIVSRWQLFLKTDRPYEWPMLSGRQHVLHALAAVVTLGFSARLVRRRFKQTGDLAVWPFLRRADYDEAMKSPAYL
jgi:hypothetical protein